MKLAVFVGLLLGFVGAAHAQERDTPSSPWTYRLNVGGSFITGNLYQIQLSTTARLT